MFYTLVVILSPDEHSVFAVFLYSRNLLLENVLVLLGEVSGISPLVNQKTPSDLRFSEEVFPLRR